MKVSYRVFQSQEDKHRIVRGLHTEEEFSIGIMDTGTLNDLEQAIAWFRYNFNHNVHVITEAGRLDRTVIDTLTDITFILFDSSPSLAQRINALANTCRTTYFMVTRSDTDLVDLNWPNVRQLFETESHPVVITPLIFNRNKELIPSVRAPKLNGEEAEPLSFMPSRGTDMNLYPFLGIGIYNRAVFQRLRGFDEEITGAYWQVMDFGTRAWLYGYSAYSVNFYAIIFFNKQFLIEDRSETQGFGRFYAKAMCVKIVRGKARIRRCRKADRHIIYDEVKQKAGLYRTDYETLCDNWKTSE